MTIEQPEQRKLAAIMFTDMVGYSALTQRSESRALRLLEEHNQLLRPIFAKFGGKEIKTIGDAFLVEFSSALDAARCSMEIQKILFERNARIASDEHIQVRIGLHVGDIVYKGNDVFGDGVNIAARIEPLANPGGVCLSEDVARQIQNKIELPLFEFGRRELKNIELPVKIYAIMLPWESSQLHFSNRLSALVAGGRMRRVGYALAVSIIIAAYFLLKPQASSDQFSKNRVAVLPFVNISADTHDEYFADGMTEEMIASLSKISGLSVIARTSVTKYKGATLNVAQIGNELMVGTILEGSVRKAMEKARITVNLIDAATQKQLWSMDYDREIKDVFAIQSEIAERVTEAMKVQLLASEKAQIGQSGTNNMQAYELLLVGRSYFNQRTPESVQKSLELFQQAIKQDPAFAAAYSSLADSYSLLAVGYGSLSVLEALPKAKEAALKAIALNENLAEAHASLAYVLFRLAWDWKGAEKEFKRAIELQPSYARAHETYALYLAMQKRLDEALFEMKRASELDPLSPSVGTGLSRVLQFRGELDEAIMQCKKTIDRHPEYAEAHFALAMILSQKGHFDESLVEFKRASELSGKRPIILAVQAYLYKKMGKKAESRQVLDELLMRAKATYIPHVVLGEAYIAVGEIDRAFESFDKAYQERDPILQYFKIDGLYDELKTDPRYKTLLTKIGLE